MGRANSLFPSLGEQEELICCSPETKLGNAASRYPKLWRGMRRPFPWLRGAPATQDSLLLEDCHIPDSVRAKFKNLYFTIAQLFAGPEGRTRDQPRKFSEELYTLS